jgi:hypothetical protein
MPGESTTSIDLFRLNATARAYLHLVGGRIPVMLIDDIFEHPARVRASALKLSYHAPGYSYPGKIAEPNPDDPSLQGLLRTILSMVNREYLPRIPPISENGRQITAFARVLPDFAITDVHPDDLDPVQRQPHIDPVPIFGLIYLNPVPRGGTLFFDRLNGNDDPAEGSGYLTESNDGYELIGKIEGQFNRLAVYPGFVPHSGEIVGDWIRGDERFSAPRLTQRLVFFP